MRVGVEEPVDEDLVQIGAEQLERQAGPVDLLPHQRRQRRDLLPFHHLHRQHPGAGVIVDRAGHDEARERREVVGDARQVARLTPVIEFLGNHAAELVDHLLEVELRARGRVVVEKFGDIFDGRQVLGHALADVRALHLDGDFPAVAQRGAMHLSERRRRQRLGVE